VGYEFQRVSAENVLDFCGLCGFQDSTPELLAGRRRRADHLERMLHDGLDGTVAIDEAGGVGGFVLLVPIERSGLAIEGENLNVIQCIHVREDCRQQQIAKELLAQAISLSQEKDGLAVVAWDRENHFPEGFFRHFAFRTVDSCGPLRLMVRLLRNIPPPRWTVHEENLELASTADGHLLHVFDNPTCGQNLPALRRLRRVLDEDCGDEIQVVVHGAEEASDRRSPCFELTTYLDGRLLTVGHLGEDSFRERIRHGMGAGSAHRGVH